MAEDITTNKIQLAKPSWLKVKFSNSKNYSATKDIINSLKLNTVCEEANCPNIGECWSNKQATLMILGSVCTRNCRFCNIATGRPDLLDPHEPERIAKSVFALQLEHVVITSVDRDDLPDGGAKHFAECITQIKKTCPNTTIEVLTPDFLRKGDVYKYIIEAGPDVFNHNIETVPSLYTKIRPGARYYNSLNLLHNVKKLSPNIFTKSGLMLGLGESISEVKQVMDDLRTAEVDFLTIGQYLQPTDKHAPIIRYVSPEEFKSLEKVAYNKGFLMVASSPLTRSSYHAGKDFKQLQLSRINQLNIKQHA